MNKLGDFSKNCEKGRFQEVSMRPKSEQSKKFLSTKRTSKCSTIRKRTLRRSFLKWALKLFVMRTIKRFQNYT